MATRRRDPRERLADLKAQFDSYGRGGKAREKPIHEGIASAEAARPMSLAERIGELQRAGKVEELCTLSREQGEGRHVGDGPCIDAAYEAFKQVLLGPDRAREAEVLLYLYGHQEIDGLYMIKQAIDRELYNAGLSPYARMANLMAHLLPQDAYEATLSEETPEELRQFASRLLFHYHFIQIEFRADTNDGTLDGLQGYAFMREPAQSEEHARRVIDIGRERGRISELRDIVNHYPEGSALKEYARAAYHAVVPDEQITDHALPVLPATTFTGDTAEPLGRSTGDGHDQILERVLAEPANIAVATAGISALIAGDRFTAAAEAITSTLTNCQFSTAEEVTARGGPVSWLDVLNGREHISRLATIARSLNPRMQGSAVLLGNVLFLLGELHAHGTLTSFASFIAQRDGESAEAKRIAQGVDLQKRKIGDHIASGLRDKSSATFAELFYGEYSDARDVAMRIISHYQSDDFTIAICAAIRADARFGSLSSEERATIDKIYVDRLQIRATVQDVHTLFSLLDGYVHDSAGPVISPHAARVLEALDTIAAYSTDDDIRAALRNGFARDTSSGYPTELQDRMRTIARRIEEPTERTAPMPRADSDATHPLARGTSEATLPPLRARPPPVPPTGPQEIVSFPDPRVKVYGAARTTRVMDITQIEQLNTLGDTDALQAAILDRNSRTPAAAIRAVERLKERVLAGNLVSTFEALQRNARERDLEQEVQEVIARELENVRRLKRNGAGRNGKPVQPLRAPVDSPSRAVPAAPVRHTSPVSAVAHADDPEVVSLENRIIEASKKTGRSRTVAMTRLRADIESFPDEHIDTLIKRLEDMLLHNGRDVFPYIEALALAGDGRVIDGLATVSVDTPLRTQLRTLLQSARVRLGRRYAKEHNKLYRTTDDGLISVLSPAVAMGMSALSGAYAGMTYGSAAGISIGVVSGVVSLTGTVIGSVKNRRAYYIKYFKSRGGRI